MLIKRETRILVRMVESLGLRQLQVTDKPHIRAVN